MHVGWYIFDFLEWQLDADAQTCVLCPDFEGRCEHPGGQHRRELSLREEASAVPFRDHSSSLPFFSAQAELVTSSRPRFLPLSRRAISHTEETNRQMSYFLPPAERHPPTGVDLPADPRSCPQSVTLGLFHLASGHRSATISCQRWLRRLEIDHSQLSNCVVWDCAHAYLCVSVQVSEWNQRKGIL